ncbi:phage protein NinX family protein [Proteus terrae]|uniref:phage protein NinX family protein n=1 Tax=Proteus terrae TaxID=1574161 RepID=UPI001C5FC368|nr:phage protein NinX family protein [Proteus terrae]
MNKYTELSDFEINKKVAVALGLISEVTHYGVVAKSNNKDYWFEFDPCNNPSDAMPIIIENKICTAFDVFAEEHDGGNWVASPAYGFANEETRSNNLYRAAMELFLMMRDAERETNT